MRWAAAVCLLGLSGCGRPAGSSLSALFAESRLQLDRGEIAAASRCYMQAYLLSGGARGRPEEWTLRSLHAGILLQQRNYSRTLAVLNPALPEDQPPAVAVRVWLDRAAANTYSGRFAAAECSLSEAARLNRSSGGPAEGQVLLRRAALARMLGRPADTEAYLPAAIAAARQTHSEFIQAIAMGSLGAILMDQGRYGQSVDWTRQAVDLDRRLAFRSRLETDLGNSGWSYYNMGDLEKALPALNEAERVAAGLHLPRQQALWLNDLGLVFTERGDAVSAAGYYSRALTLSRQAGDSALNARILHNLAVSAFDREDFTAAGKFHGEEMRIKSASGDASDKLYARYIEGALEARARNYPAARSAYEDVVRDSSDLALLWQARIQLALVHMAQKETALAQSDFDAALRTFEKARRELPADQFKITFRAQLNRYYSVYIRFLMDQGKELEALRVAELSRAQVLAERLNVSENARLDKAGLIQTAKSLQAVILSYWLAPRASYLWVITPEALVSYKLPDGAEIARLANEHRAALESGSAMTDTRLYRILIAHAQPHIPAGGRVIVIPDGSLFQLNFETLLVPGSPKPHFWIEDAVLSTATSLALLGLHPRPKGAPNVLLIGDAEPAAPEFPKLRNAALELHSIASRFPANRRVLYEGAEARPSAYLNANPEAFSWIHFAAHGVANSDSPLDSAIILTNEGDSFKLYAHDIAKLPLHADLVTISACFSSGTRTYAGEGIVGLAWAFLLAGAHNVIASLWEANDFYTAKLMDRLYAGLTQGKDAAHALRDAKLSLLRSAYTARYPRYWAAFQLYTGY